jgi:adenylyltransferase/sulfurtransferase
MQVDRLQPPMELSQDELDLYARHIILPEVGLEGQKRLKAARALLVGAGALGSPLGLYLAAAGVGTLGLADFDVVERSNLQRQVIHSVKSLGRPKVESARERMLEINPHVRVESFNLRVSSANALRLFQDFDIIVDGTDNFPARYLVNDACVLSGKPEVFGAVMGFTGQAAVFDARKGCCLRCLFPDPPDPGLTPSCGEYGVFGVLPGIIGCIQANEVLKLIVGGGKPLINRLLSFDALAMRFHEFKAEKNPACPVCGERPVITSLADYDYFCDKRKTKDAPPASISPGELKRRLERGERMQIIDVRLPHELVAGCLPEAVSLPARELLRRMDELDPGQIVILVCKTGAYSAAAIAALRAAGYNGPLFNLAGGMNAWAPGLSP